MCYGSNLLPVYPEIMPAAFIENYCLISVNRINSEYVISVGKSIHTYKVKKKVAYLFDVPCRFVSNVKLFLTLLRLARTYGKIRQNKNKMYISSS